MNERIPILFERTLRPEWIDFALEQYLSSKNADELRQKLHAYLAPQVKGVQTVEKAARQLQRTVGFASPIPRDELERAYQELSALAPSERTLIRLRLLTRATPFVADCVSALRKLKVLGVRGVTVQQMYERMAARYGDRSTVYPSVRRVLRTLALMGVVENREHKWWLLCDDHLHTR